MFKVQQLPLWDVLESDKVDNAQRARVEELLQRAAAILDRVIETFPTYTLHNSTHAENVVRLMAELLGPWREKLTPLEAALLMLSAFYHDIGMVFREEERNRLTEEPEWKTFLDTKPDAYIAMKKAGEVPPLDIAEWYCRWRHADRVWVYLNRVPDELLKWGRTSIREELGDLCQSHNLPAADLYELRTDFRGEADLRFCAILLRLADILDFDDTRSGEAVYELLGLSRHLDPRQKASDTEWRKHLCSEGFRFPEKRPDGYQLGFVAGPDEPRVEHEVRVFLRVIEEEMEQCRVLLATCSERWRTLPLPVNIERSNIHSNGYRYGEYRFTLDQEQIIDLLMGENLYGGPHVFVRELVQNALDTSRHRRFIERASGNPDFEPKPIQARHWIDRDGYQWVRFDDYGMGMDEQIVRQHLLKAGSSYYRTSSFRAEILRVRDKMHQDFVPISRFGIGLLSCFIVGDRIEVSTLRRTSAGNIADPVRLSLNSLHGFFTFQTPQLPAISMPSPDGEEAGYRLSPGTSIAVRLDPLKDRSTFDLAALLDRYVAFSPVPIEFDGKRVGEGLSLIDHALTDRGVIELEARGLQEISGLLNRPLREPLYVEFLPIDLTKHSPVVELKGQLVHAVFRPSPELINISETEQLYIHLSAGHEKFVLEIRLVESPRLPLGTRYVAVEPPGRFFPLLSNRPQSWLSHNGVCVPTRYRSSMGSSSSDKCWASWTHGLIALYDSLRPEMSVSREELRSLPWRVHSVANLALYRCLRELGEELSTHRRGIFLDNLHEELLGELANDEFLRSEDGWATMPIVETKLGLMSVLEIRNHVNRSGENIEVILSERIDFMAQCQNALVQLWFSPALHDRAHLYGDVRPTVLISEGDPAAITEGHKLFPPLTFIPFLDSRWLTSTLFPVTNSNHPFSAWLLAKGPEILKRYPGLFDRIRELLRSGPNRKDFQCGLNQALDRLRKLDPSVRPSTDLVITEEDIHD
jgi:hypothetical protein